MQISAQYFQQLGVNSIINQQSKLNELQIKLSSGKQYLNSSENPAASERILNINQAISQTTQYQSNIDAANQRLSLEETTLNSVVDILNKLKDLGVQSLNGINNASNRQTIAAQFDSLNQQLLGLANTKDANGEYLFAGYLSRTPPFKATGSNTTPFYAYQGSNDQRSIQIGETQKIVEGDSGSSVFGPSTPGGTNSIFDIVKQFSNELKQNNPSASTLSGIDTVLNNVISIQSSIGSRMNTLDAQQTSNGDYITTMQTVLSQAQDLNYAKAISQYTQMNVSLQAAQQTFTKVQKLSLFNYI